MPKAAFVIGVPNPADSEVSIYIRKRIKDEFHGGQNKWPLQCTEGAAFFLLYNHGVVIDWPIKFGRHGGVWDDIFKTFFMYNVEAEPTPGGTIHISSGLGSVTANQIGHVAYIQKVNKAGDVYVKEFNWPNKGKYNERWITRDRWTNHYKARFVRYT